jgi:hypothetical protein
MMRRALVFLALLGFGSCAWALSQFVQDIPVTRGLVARWDIEEGTGTTSTRDETGNGHTATLHNISEGDWGAGPISSRYWLDTHSGSGYLSVADADVFSFTDGSTTNYPFSAEVCAKPSSVGGTALLAKSVSYHKEWLFRFISTHLRLQINDTSLIEIADDLASPDVLHSYGFSYDGDQTIVLYVDGAPVPSTTTGTGGVMSNTSADVNIGTLNNSSSYSLAGPIAFAQIYSVELTQEEHAKIAQECRE